MSAAEIKVTIDITDEYTLRDAVMDIVREAVSDENQKLLLKFEEIVMSVIKPYIDSLVAKSDALIARVSALEESNSQLTETAALKDVQIIEQGATITSLSEQIAEKDQKIAESMSMLSDAIKKAVDDSDIETLQTVLQKMTDALA